MHIIDCSVFFLEPVNKCIPQLTKWTFNLCWFLLPTTFLKWSFLWQLHSPMEHENHLPWQGLSLNSCSGTWSTTNLCPVNCPVSKWPAQLAKQTQPLSHVYLTSSDLHHGRFGSFPYLHSTRVSIFKIVSFHFLSVNEPRNSVLVIWLGKLLEIWRNWTMAVFNYWQMYLISFLDVRFLIRLWHCGRWEIYFPCISQRFG